MKFFINDAILRKECSEIKKIGNHEIELVIPNYLEDKGKCEDIFFQEKEIENIKFLINIINIYLIKNVK